VKALKYFCNYFWNVKIVAYVSVVKIVAYVSVAQSGSILGSGSVGSVIFQKSSEEKRPENICFIYIAFIFKKHVKDKLVAEYMKTCIFVHQYR
jgi:hypothetical protein